MHFVIVGMQETIPPIIQARFINSCERERIQGWNNSNCKTTTKLIDFQGWMLLLVWKLSFFKQSVHSADNPKGVNNSKTLRNLKQVGFSSNRPVGNSIFNQACTSFRIEIDVRF